MSNFLLQRFRSPFRLHPLLGDNPHGHIVEVTSGLLLRGEARWSGGLVVAIFAKLGIADKVVLNSLRGEVERQAGSVALAV